jgi:8-oxo-dGTP diphosphatase
MANEDVFHLGIKALVIDPEDNILLLRVNLGELQGYKGTAYWDIPGGRIHRGDGIIDTLRRELKEETGLNLEKIPTFVGATVSNIRIPVGSGDVGLILFVYRCPFTTRPNVCLSSEHTDFAWVSPNEAATALLTKYPTDFVEIVKRRSQDALSR